MNRGGRQVFSTLQLSRLIKDAITDALFKDLDTDTVFTTHICTAPHLAHTHTITVTVQGIHLLRQIAAIIIHSTMDTLIAIHLRLQTALIITHRALVIINNRILVSVPHSQ